MQKSCMKIFHNASFVYHVLKKVTAYENDTELTKQSLIDTKALVWIFSVSRTLSLSSPFWLPKLCYCYSLPLEIPACAIKEPAMEAIGLRWTDDLWATAERMGTEQIGTLSPLNCSWSIFGLVLERGQKNCTTVFEHTQFPFKKCCKSSCKKAKFQLRDQFQLC